MDRREIFGLSVSALKAKLSVLALDAQGLKGDLRRRLLGHYGMDLTNLSEEDGSPGVYSQRRWRFSHA